MQTSPKAWPSLLRGRKFRAAMIGILVILVNNRFHLGLTAVELGAISALLGLVIWGTAHEDAAEKGNRANGTDS